jgi:hypothetical protein
VIFKGWKRKCWSERKIRVKMEEILNRTVWMKEDEMMATEKSVSKMTSTVLSVGNGSEFDVLRYEAILVFIKKRF